jgi:hypothetical protein
LRTFIEAKKRKNFEFFLSQSLCLRIIRKLDDAQRCAEMREIMKSCELVTFITAAACKIYECFPTEEVSLLAAAFTQLGDTLTTLVVHEEVCDTKTEAATDDTSNQGESATQFTNYK